MIGEFEGDVSCPSCGKTNSVEMIIGESHATGNGFYAESDSICEYCGESYQLEMRMIPEFDAFGI